MNVQADEQTVFSYYFHERVDYNSTDKFKKEKEIHFHFHRTIVYKSLK